MKDAMSVKPGPDPLFVVIETSEFDELRQLVADLQARMAYYANGLFHVAS